jgi:hypothetical protein
MHLTLALSGEHGMQLERAPVHNFNNIVRMTYWAHNITVDSGLMVGDEDSAVPKSGANILVR